MKISKLNIEDNKGSLLSAICAMEDKINEIIDTINVKGAHIMKKDLKTVTEDHIADRTEEESATEKILDSILEKGLSIMNKVLDRIDKKLDDEEFMKKVEDSLIVEDWRK